MLKTNSIATVGNRNKYGANREPHRDGLGGVSNDLPVAGDMVLGVLIPGYFCSPPLVGLGPAAPYQRLVSQSTRMIVGSLTHLLLFAVQLRRSDITQIDHSLLG